MSHAERGLPELLELLGDGSLTILDVQRINGCDEAAAARILQTLIGTGEVEHTGEYYELRFGRVVRDEDSD